MLSSRLCFSHQPHLSCPLSYLLHHLYFLQILQCTKCSLLSSLAHAMLDPCLKCLNASIHAMMDD
jgi:hypothetical protein